MENLREGKENKVMAGGRMEGEKVHSRGKRKRRKDHDRRRKEKKFMA